MNRHKDEFTREWITENAIDIIGQYNPGELTIRALHYQLVSRGMTNTMQHYKRVVSAMEVARWDRRVDFEAFSDLDRTVVGETKAKETNVEDSVQEAKNAIDDWMNIYFKNRWENQPVYPEMFIEKKALQSVFQGVCQKNDIALSAVKGYPSLTFLHEAAERFKYWGWRRDRRCVVLYFGDYDPSGEDIPRSIEENLKRMGADVEVIRFALFESQVIEWKLPPAPAKETDSRTAKWDGLGQVELDAVSPKVLKELAQSAIDTVFDKDLHDKLMEVEREERALYRKELKDYFSNL